MGGVRVQGEKVRDFILNNVEVHSKDIVRLTAEEFGISRQAVNQHLTRLLHQKSLVAKGTTRNRTYALHPLVSWQAQYPLNQPLEEDIVWRVDIVPKLGDLPDNVLDVWQYGVTEMINNVLDHSGGTTLSLVVKKTATTVEMMISDDGEGIFKRIQRLLGLHDERHAVLELAKGKLTTDPANHTGEGIFFSSRMYDHFGIVSGEVYFSHQHHTPEDWIFERDIPQSGTQVFMKMSNNSSRTVKQVFDTYTSSEDYGFNKTVVPVKLARYGNERLVSRSQAKRLLTGIEQFKIVILDFDGIDGIGQAFADEVFRVFRNKHPQLQLYFIAAPPDVEQMIIRALGTEETP